MKYLLLFHNRNLQFALMLNTVYSTKLNCERIWNWTIANGQEANREQHLWEWKKKKYISQIIAIQANKKYWCITVLKKMYSKYSDIVNDLIQDVVVSSLKFCEVSTNTLQVN